MDTPPAEPKPEDTKKITALLIVYLSALQSGPGLEDGMWHAAETMKQRLASELP